MPVGDDPVPTTIANLDGKPSPNESTGSRHCDPKDGEAEAAEIASLTPPPPPTEEAKSKTTVLRGA